MRYFTSLAAIASALALVSCGSPDGPVEKFAFTPEPFVTLVPVSGPTIVDVLDSDGSPRYTADSVGVIVEKKQRDDFLDWVADTPFEVMAIYFDETDEERDPRLAE